MSPEGGMIAVILLCATLFWVAAPLLRARAGQPIDDGLAEKRRERLLVYYERVLTNIHDLDEDLATGKIADDDHHAERETWVQRGVEVLRALDNLDGVTVTLTAADDAAIDREIDLAIEAAVAAYRHDSGRAHVQTGAPAAGVRAGRVQRVGRRAAHRSDFAPRDGAS